MSDEKVTETPEGVLKQRGVMNAGNGVLMTREHYLRSIGYDTEMRPLTVVAHFDSGEWWQKKDRTWVRIADMSPGHRYNSAAMLMRGARVHAWRYATGFSGEVSSHDGGDMAHDLLERISDELFRQGQTDPEAWLRKTELYRALTAGLTMYGDGRAPWQATGHDPATGEPCEVPPRMEPVCEITACGCPGKAHA